MFNDTSRFNRSLDLLSKGLDVTVLRRQTIANNIANVDTPHYKRQFVTFESELNRAIESHNKKPTPTLRTHQKHFYFDVPKDPQEVKAKVQVEYDSNFRNDKNNVDIEKEISDSVKMACIIKPCPAPFDFLLIEFAQY